MAFSFHTTCMPCLSQICPVDTIFINHLVDSDLGVEIFKKEGAIKKGVGGVEIGDFGASSILEVQTSIGGLRKFHLEPVWFFIIFCLKKKRNSL